MVTISKEGTLAALRRSINNSLLLCMKRASAPLECVFCTGHRLVGCVKWIVKFALRGCELGGALAWRGVAGR